MVYQGRLAPRGVGTEVTHSGGPRESFVELAGCLLYAKSRFGIHVPYARVVERFLYPAREFTVGVVGNRFSVCASHTRPGRPSTIFASHRAGAAGLLLSARRNHQTTHCPCGVLGIYEVTTTVGQMGSPLVLCTLLPAMGRMGVGVTIAYGNCGSALTIRLRRDARILRSTS